MDRSLFSRCALARRVSTTPATARTKQHTIQQQQHQMWAKARAQEQRAAISRSLKQFCERVQTSLQVPQRQKGVSWWSYSLIGLLSPQNRLRSAMCCPPLQLVRILILPVAIGLFPASSFLAGVTGTSLDPLLYRLRTKDHHRRASVRRPAALFSSATRQLCPDRT